jgi:hypothetical protein
MISSTTKPIERPASENTSSGCAPSVLIRTSELTRHERHEVAAILHEVSAARQLDLSAIDFLEPRDERERNRLRLRGPGAEHQHGDGLVQAGVALRFGFLFGAGYRGRADRLGDSVRIDDHDHRAVAQNGIAREHRDVAQLGRHRLDHDFLGVEHAVDHDAEGLISDLRHNDEAVLRLGWGAGIHVQQLLEVDERQ